MLWVARSCHDSPLSIQSNEARAFAQPLAACASLGLITTQHGDGFGRRWRLTPRGMFFMHSGGHL